jgi:hypothetical protein
MSLFTESKSKPKKQEERGNSEQPLVCRLILSGFLFGLHFNLEDTGSTFLQNFGGLLPDDTA